jgi:inhibitor of cysteine peptidase
MNGRMLAALMLTAAPLLACAGKAEGPNTQDPQTQTIQISYADLSDQSPIRRNVTMAVGDFLQVSLGSNASTGYRWAEQMQISDPKVLAQTGHEAIAPRDAMPGAPGSEVWVLQAMAPGKATVSTTYSRPWEGGEKDTFTFTADVTVS